MDGQRKALIVANDQYEHEGLRHLVSPAADADALAGVLGDPQIGEFDVRVVRNEPAHVIEGQIEDLLCDSRRDDVILLHFSCHGLKSESGELFFAARNTRPNRLASTAISAEFVQRCMRESRSASIVLLLDCCYGGAFSQGVSVRATGDVNVLDSFPGGNLGGGRGRAVITASSAMEYAFEGEQLADDHSPRPSVFTSALVHGLSTGEADRDEDGWVSLNELYDYVFDRVRAQNPHQTPSRDVEMQGELYVARSRRQRIRPQPIPTDLHAAMTDRNMFTRLGAVTELRTRLLGGNLPAAAGARDALADIAAKDLQFVATAATAALGEATLTASEQELHFGRVTQGSAAGQRAIRLLGPPLARACTVQASHGWIRVEETAEGLNVSVDTSHAGPWHGEIVIKGPTGEVLIPVHVDVTPRPAPAPTSVRPPEPRPTPSPQPAPALPAEPSPVEQSDERRSDDRRHRVLVRALVSAGVIAAVAIALLGLPQLANRGDPSTGPSTDPTVTPQSTSTSGRQIPIPQSAVPLPSAALVIPLDSRQDAKRDLFVVNRDGARGKQLTSDRGIETFPAISPDRRTIAFIRREKNTIAFVAADGSTKPLEFRPKPPACASVTRPGWRPDGRALVVACGKSGEDRGLYVLDLDGNLVTRLPTLPTVDDPAWSPDGKTVVYWGKSDTSAESPILYRVAADGKSAPVALTKSSPGGDADPAWSPDGKRIAYRHVADIFVMNADGSNAEALTTSGDSNQDPTWSADGAEIAFKSGRDGGSVQVMKADGTGRRLLLRVPGDNWAPAWTTR